MVTRLGIVIHQHRHDVLALAKRAISWCGRSVEPVMCTTDAALYGQQIRAVDDARFGQSVDVCLSLGGDGTMLRSVGLVSQHDVPILGVNAGHLGYLTEVDPDHMEQALQAWVDGELVFENRMMLEVTSPEHPEWVGHCLNEAVVYRSESGRSLEVSASINGRHFTTYLADGVMVATPTGSTAYSLSAGGPIVEPDFHALLLTPVAAHMVFNRSMVFAPTTAVSLTVEGYKPAVVALDGQTSIEISPGESVHCRSAESTATFLVSGQKDFHRVLKDKFGLGDR